MMSLYEDSGKTSDCSKIIIFNKEINWNMKLNRIVINNFKSIKNLDLNLSGINILIGSNGAGKSNFIQFFDLLQKISRYNLSEYVVANGGANTFLHFGIKNSSEIKGVFYWGQNSYEFILAADTGNNFYFKSENAEIEPNLLNEPTHSGFSQNKANRFLLAEHEKNSQTVKDIIHAVRSLSVYHFQDTGLTSKIKRECDVNDNRFLRSDASNLAAFLYLLQQKYPEILRRIEQTLRITAPFFDKFLLAPLELNNERIRLEWKQAGTDEYFNASYLSDGTLRMICLITLFLQPNAPDTIIIDEPELGLHPAAIELLSALIKSAAAEGKQIICSTQSVTLLNHFRPEDIIVVDRKNGESIFNRLDENALADWLADYSIGELWEKNVIGGRP